MNPSSSSNAEPDPQAVYKVGTRQLDRELTAAGPEHSARDLGRLGAAQLREVATKLAAFDTAALGDADPHLVASGRRGRFLVRPWRGGVRLSDANDPARSPLDLAVNELPAYLDGADPKAEIETAANPPAKIDATQARTGLVLALFFGSVLSVGLSAYLTFRTNPIDAAVPYTAISADEAQTIVLRNFTGTFTTGSGEGSRAITFDRNGVVKYTEFGPDNAIATELTDRFTLALRDGKVPTARTAELGPIESRDANTLFYAGETYTRPP